MTDTLAPESTDLDELGPVDWIVVEFPGTSFRHEIASELAGLAERRLVRILDLLMIRKDEEGVLDVLEMSDLDEGELGTLVVREAELATLLSEEDVYAAAAAVEPGSTGALLVWENSWAAPFGSAVRRAGGQLVASGRIPTQALLAAIEQDPEMDDPEEEN